MKRQKVQLIAILVILILCIGSYVFLLKYNAKVEEDEETDDYTILTLDTDDIVKIVLETSDDGEVFTLVKSDDVWSVSGDDETDIDESAVEDLLNDGETITSDKEITDVTDFEMYGLDEPALTITFTDSSDNEYKLSIGDYSSSASMYYARVNDESTVYLVDSTVYSAFNIELDDLVAEEEEDSSTDSSTTDASAEDSSETDSGEADASTEDTGTTDSSSEDASTTDVSSEESSDTDSSSEDASSESATTDVSSEESN